MEKTIETIMQENYRKHTSEYIPFVRINRIKSSLRRIQFVNPQYSQKDIYNRWVEETSKNIGKTSNQLKLEANTNDFCKAIINNPQCIPLAEEALISVEANYGIYRKTNRDVEMKKDINKSYLITKMGQADILPWFDDKCRELSDICHCTKQIAQDKLYNTFLYFAEKHTEGKKETVRKSIPLDKLSGSFDKDKDVIFNDCYLKGWLVYTAIGSTIGAI